MAHNHFIIPYTPTLDQTELSANEMILEASSLRLPIMTVNWPEQYPYIPVTTADLAYSDTGLYCRFQSKGRGLLAQYTEDGSPVHNDSCVELFLQLPGDERYYNFEFNCIGTCDASHRISRHESRPLTPAEYQMIQRATSEQRGHPLDRPQEIQRFEVSIKLDFNLFGIASIDELPDHLTMNLYKCGDKTIHPHFASWQPIDTPTPDFHCPEFFQKVYFQRRK